MDFVLNGTQFFNAFAAGSRAVFKKRDDIDRINVFPVPDGDTGSNLSFTLKSAVDNAHAHDSFGKTLRSIADSILLGARGNSGLLFAQFINGFADAVGDLQHMTKDHLVASVRKGVASAYSAISNPVEGTMLTVMREWSESMDEERSQHPDIVSMLSKTLAASRKSLLRTKEMLGKIRKVHIIDAGAKGFVEFLHGFVNYLDTASQGKALPDQQPSSEAFAGKDALPDFEGDEHDAFGSAEDIGQRYCTECIVNGRNLDSAKIREVLSSMGDSLIVAGSPHVVRVHVHTNKPGEVFKVLTSQGLVSQQKADDMILQFRVAHEKHPEIGILVDSTCDLPDEILTRHRITMVPLEVRFGEQAYLDRITLEIDHFYDLLETSRDFPRTSQPSPAMLRRSLQYLSSHFSQIIAVHISSGLSGTYDNCAAESRKLNEEAASADPGAARRPLPLVTAIDSKTTSAEIGLCVIRAAEDIEAGMAYDSVVSRLRENFAKARYFVLVPGLENLVRGGRLGRPKAALATLLNLKPILTTSKTDGKAYTLAKGFGQEGMLKKTMSMISAMIARGPIQSWAIVHGKAPERAREVAAKIQDRSRWSRIPSGLQNWPSTSRPRRC